MSHRQDGQLLADAVFEEYGELEELQIGGSGYLLADGEQPDLADTIMECLTRLVELPSPGERRRPNRFREFFQPATSLKTLKKFPPRTFFTSSSL